MSESAFVRSSVSPREGHGESKAGTLELRLGILVERVNSLNNLADTIAGVIVDSDVDGETAELLSETAEKIREIDGAVKKKLAMSLIEQAGLRKITRRFGLRARAVELVERAMGHEVTRITPLPQLSVAEDVPESTAIVKPLPPPKRRG